MPRFCGAPLVACAVALLALCVLPSSEGSVVVRTNPEPPGVQRFDVEGKSFLVLQADTTCPHTACFFNVMLSRTRTLNNTSPPYQGYSLSLTVTANTTSPTPEMIYPASIESSEAWVSGTLPPFQGHFWVSWLNNEIVMGGGTMPKQGQQNVVRLPQTDPPTAINYLFYWTATMGQRAPARKAKPVRQVSPSPIPVANQNSSVFEVGCPNPGVCNILVQLQDTEVFLNPTTSPKAYQILLNVTNGVASGEIVCPHGKTAGPLGPYMGSFKVSWPMDPYGNRVIIVQTLVGSLSLTDKDPMVVDYAFLVPFVSPGRLHLGRSGKH